MSLPVSSEEFACGLTNLEISHISWHRALHKLVSGRIWAGFYCLESKLCKMAPIPTAGAKFPFIDRPQGALSAPAYPALKLPYFSPLGGIVL